MREALPLTLAALFWLAASGLSAQTEIRGRWSDLTPTTGTALEGRIGALPDGRLLHAGAVYSTSVDGESWEPFLQRPLPTRSRVVVQDGNVFVLDGTAGRLYVLRQGELDLLLQVNAGDQLSLTWNEAGTLWLAAAGALGSGTSSLWQSDDAGESWQLRSNERLGQLLATPNSGPLLALRNRPSFALGALSSSNDEGRTWTDRVPGATQICQDPNSSTTVWAFEELVPATRIPSTTLIRSEDQGITWEKAGPRHLQSFALTSSGLLGIDVDARFGILEGPLLGSDGFNVWQPVDGVEPASSVSASTGGEVVVLRNRFSPSYRLSIDGGLSFVQKSLPKRSIPTAFAIAGESITTNSGGSSDSGATWEITEASGFDRFVALGDSTVLASALRFLSLGRLAVSADGGYTFDDIGIDGFGIDLISSAQPSSNGNPPIVFLLPRQSCLIFTSEDLGNSWKDSKLTPCRFDLKHDPYIEAFAARSDASGNRAVLQTRETNLTGSTIYRVWLVEPNENARQIVEPRTPLLSNGFLKSPFSSVAFDGEDIVTLGTPSQRSADNGETWRTFPADEGEELVAWRESPLTPGLQFAASKRSAYRSTDDGNSWQRIVGSEDAGILDLQLVNDHTVVILTENGLYRWTSSDCVPGPASLCLGGRFRVTASFSAGGPLQTARSFPLTEDTGTFWFFEPDNLEILVKVLDGCNVNGHYWVFTAGLTDVEVEIEITELPNGNRWTTEHPGSSVFPPGSDVQAFACSSAPSATTSD
ncbi:MAG: sialidase family protein [Acidobacteriota bacterium]